MKHVLLTYETVPEKLEQYLLEVTGEELEYLRTKIHGKLINCNMEEKETDWLLAFLVCKVPLDTSIIHQINIPITLINTGFIL